jgi:hypothetical protein
MLLYHVTEDNMVPTACRDQIHLMKLLEQWGLSSRMLHYTSPSIQCAVYHDALDTPEAIAMVVRRVTGSLSRVHCREVLRWVRINGRNTLYPPLRGGMSQVESTPQQVVTQEPRVTS